MADQSQIPDRRPLIYGLMAVAVLLAATALFWPSSDESSPDTLVLTPESLQVAAESTPTANPATSVNPETVSDEELAVEPLPRGETEIVDAIPSGERSSTTIRVEGVPPEAGSQTRAERPQALPQSAIPASRSGSGLKTSGPVEDGGYVLNVGSFKTRLNADSMVLDLQKKGIPAHVRAATSKGATVYRVRVGYFESSGEAAAYARELKKEFGMDAWTSQR
jgi:cell division protein FtsN